MELLEELPLFVLFGAHGERVVALLEQIQALSRTQAECLAANLDPDAGHAYGRAWLRWSEAQGQQRSTPADDWEQLRWRARARTNRPFIPVSAGS